MPRFAIVITDRQGNIRTGLTVKLINASTEAELHSMAESSNQRGLYYYDYELTDTTLYKLKIAGSVDTERGSFYLSTLGLVSSSNTQTVVMTEDGEKGQCVQVVGKDGASGYPTAQLCDITAAHPRCDGVLRASANSGDQATVVWFGSLDGLSLSFAAQNRLYVGSDSYVTDSEPDYASGYARIAVGTALDSDEAFINLGGVPR